MNNNVKRLTRIAIIAATYAALTLAFAPMSYGVIQLRISEALTVLAALSFDFVLGLTVGCFISNLFGVFFGTTGVIDIFLGTLATLIAALICYSFKNIKNERLFYFLCPIPSILSNAIIIGMELAFFLGEGTFFMNALSCGLSELIICYVIGVPLLISFKKSKTLAKLIT